MPSIAPTRTSGMRLALALMKASTRARSVDDENAYQNGRDGGVRTAGVEVSMAPMRLSGMPLLPTPKRKSRTQLTIDWAWAASVACSVATRLAALFVSKRSGVFDAGLAVKMLRE